MKESLLKKIIKEEVINIINEGYTSESIDSFIAQSDVTSGYNPRVKFESGEASTKWLDLDWDTISAIADLIRDKGR